MVAPKQISKSHSEIAWREIPAERPTYSFFVRATVIESDYFNYGFTEEEWSCWQLEDATGDYRLFGYVPAGSDMDLQLQGELRDQAKPKRMMLRLRYPYPQGEEGVGGNQLEISEIISSGWVVESR